MKCLEARPLLSLYFDGELDAPQRAQVEAHLRACAACAARLDDYAQLSREIRALPRLPAPAQLRAGVMEQVSAGRPATGWGRRLNRLGSTAVFAAVLLLLAWGLVSLLRGWQHKEGPRVLLASPADGATGVSVRESLRITFDRPMDQEAVVAALQISPSVELAFAWQDATLTAVPLDEWSPATAYTLTIGQGARDADGRALEQPFRTTFDTSGAGGSLAPIGRLGHVWRASFDGPGGQLGFAVEAERETWSAWQPFERGLMFWQDNADQDLIIVLFYGADHERGSWQRFTDAWREGDPEQVGYTPPTGLLEPVRGFGRVWREELDGGPAGSAALGWAIVPEQGFAGLWQSFERGLMLWNPVDEKLYVLLDDGSWQRFPDPWSQ
jgi:hypothetical protein